MCRTSARRFKLQRDWAASGRFPPSVSVASLARSLAPRALPHCCCTGPWRPPTALDPLAPRSSFECAPRRPSPLPRRGVSLVPRRFDCLAVSGPLAAREPLMESSQRAFTFFCPCGCAISQQGKRCQVFSWSSRVEIALWVSGRSLRLISMVGSTYPLSRTDFAYS